MNIVGLIPARGGSKGVSLKNIRELHGKPLIYWSIQSALNSSILDRVIVSTDHAEISNIARESGAEVPFMRPESIATDTTKDLPVCKHTINWLLENESYKTDIIVWLRPTTPLRATIDIENAVNLLIETKANCVRSISEVQEHPYWMKTMNNNLLSPLMEGKDEKVYFNRQTLPPVYIINGVVDVVWADYALSLSDDEPLFSGKIAGYETSISRSIDIDTLEDFELAEKNFSKR